jgi:hypothetical protein
VSAFTAAVTSGVSQNRKVPELCGPKLTRGRVPLRTPVLGRLWNWVEAVREKGIRHSSNLFNHGHRDENVTPLFAKASETWNVSISGFVLNDPE